MRFAAPRILNDPPRCRFSHFRYTRARASLIETSAKSSLACDAPAFEFAQPPRERPTRRLPGASALSLKFQPPLPHPSQSILMLVIERVQPRPEIARDKQR